jgi:hypothetical protein
MILAHVPPQKLKIILSHHYNFISKVRSKEPMRVFTQDGYLYPEMAAYLTSNWCKEKGEFYSFDYIQSQQKWILWLVLGHYFPSHDYLTSLGCSVIDNVIKVSDPSLSQQDQSSPETVELSVNGAYDFIETVFMLDKTHLMSISQTDLPYHTFLHANSHLPLLFPLYRMYSDYLTRFIYTHRTFGTVPYTSPRSFPSYQAHQLNLYYFWQNSTKTISKLSKVETCEENHTLIPSLNSINFIDWAFIQNEEAWKRECYPTAYLHSLIYDVDFVMDGVLCLEETAFKQETYYGDNDPGETVSQNEDGGLVESEGKNTNSDGSNYQIRNLPQIKAYFGTFWYNKNEHIHLFDTFFDNVTIDPFTTSFHSTLPVSSRLNHHLFEFDMLDPSSLPQTTDAFEDLTLEEEVNEPVCERFDIHYQPQTGDYKGKKTGYIMDIVRTPHEQSGEYDLTSLRHMARSFKSKLFIGHNFFPFETFYDEKESNNGKFGKSHKNDTKIVDLIGHAIRFAITSAPNNNGISFLQKPSLDFDNCPHIPLPAEFSSPATIPKLMDNFVLTSPLFQELLKHYITPPSSDFIYWCLQRGFTPREHSFLTNVYRPSPSLSSIRLIVTEFGEFIHSNLSSISHPAKFIPFLSFYEIHNGVGSIQIRQKFHVLNPERNPHEIQKHPLFLTFTTIKKIIGSQFPKLLPALLDKDRLMNPSYNNSPSTPFNFSNWFPTPTTPEQNQTIQMLFFSFSSWLSHSSPPQPTFSDLIQFCEEFITGYLSPNQNDPILTQQSVNFDTNGRGFCCNAKVSDIYTIFYPIFLLLSQVPFNPTEPIASYIYQFMPQYWNEENERMLSGSACSDNPDNLDNPQHEPKISPSDILQEIQENRPDIQTFSNSIQQLCSDFLIFPQQFSKSTIAEYLYYTNMDPNDDEYDANDVHEVQGEWKMTSSHNQWYLRAYLREETLDDTDVVHFLLSNTNTAEVDEEHGVLLIIELIKRNSLNEASMNILMNLIPNIDMIDTAYEYKPMVLALLYNLPKYNINVAQILLTRTTLVPDKWLSVLYSLRDKNFFSHYPQLEFSSKNELLNSTEDITHDSPHNSPPTKFILPTTVLPTAVKLYPIQPNTNAINTGQFRIYHDYIPDHLNYIQFLNNSTTPQKIPSTDQLSYLLSSHPPSQNLYPDFFSKRVYIPSKFLGPQGNFPFTWTYAYVYLATLPWDTPIDQTFFYTLSKQQFRDTCLFVNAQHERKLKSLSGEVSPKKPNAVFELQGHDTMLWDELGATDGITGTWSQAFSADSPLDLINNDIITWPSLLWLCTHHNLIRNIQNQTFLMQLLLEFLRTKYKKTQIDAKQDDLPQYDNLNKLSHHYISNFYSNKLLFLHEFDLIFALYLLIDFQFAPDFVSKMFNHIPPQYDYFINYFYQLPGKQIYTIIQNYQTTPHNDYISPHLSYSEINTVNITDFEDRLGFILPDQKADLFSRQHISSPEKIPQKVIKMFKSLPAPESTSGPDYFYINSLPLYRMMDRSPHDSVHIVYTADVHQTSGILKDQKRKDNMKLQIEDNKLSYSNNCFFFDALCKYEGPGDCNVENPLDEFLQVLVGSNGEKSPPSDDGVNSNKSHHDNVIFTFIPQKNHLLNNTSLFSKFIPDFCDINSSQEAYRISPLDSNDESIISPNSSKCDLFFQNKSPCLVDFILNSPNYIPYISLLLNPTRKLRFKLTSFSPSIFTFGSSYFLEYLYTVRNDIIMAHELLVGYDSSLKSPILNSLLNDNIHGLSCVDKNDIFHQNHDNDGPTLNSKLDIAPTPLAVPLNSFELNQISLVRLIRYNIEQIILTNSKP